MHPTPFYSNIKTSPSTFLGGSRDDVGYGMARDNAGNMYLTGYAERAFSTDPNFPTTPGAYDTSFNGRSDAFVTKIMPDVPFPVLEEPIPPGNDPVPQPEPSDKKKHLVFITHGWNSSALAWPDIMANRINAQIKEAQAAFPDIQWTVISYDWSLKSGSVCFGLALPPLPCRGPWYAYANAREVGEDVGKQLASVGYEHIHFIAHSAGSNLIQSAVKEIVFSPGNPVIHTTFLDAYDPWGRLSPYGVGSDWAEQYVDKRLVFLEPFDTTDTILPEAFNFDVTDLDPVPLGFPPVSPFEDIRRHAWPYCWYNAPLASPGVIEDCDRNPQVQNTSDFGFSFSPEGNKGQLPSHTDPRFVRGHECDLKNNPECKQSFPKWTLVRLLKTAVKAPFDVWTSAADSFVTSATGIIDLFTNEIIKLTTGSPAWISVTFEVPEPINMLRFGYQFPFSADGVLSVFFDGQLVFRADERHNDTATVVTEPIPLGKVAPGLHSLSYRLDAFNNTQSSIEISEIRTGTMQVVRPTCAGKFATIAGTDGPDVLRGTPGADVISGLGGNDVIKGGGGNDRICGDAGNDRIKGGNGRDRLYGGKGNDRVLGGKGKDKLDGGPARDTLHGGSGTDKCIRGEKKIRCES